MTSCVISGTKNYVTYVI